MNKSEILCLLVLILPDIIKRIDVLKEVETVSVVTSGGINDSSEDSMRQIIEEYNRVVKTVLSWYIGDSLDVA